MNPGELHVFFFPFLAPGHMIPMVDLAKIFASRGVKTTIVTTTGNVPLIRPTRDRSPHFIQLLTLNLQSSVENLLGLPSPTPTPEFLSAIKSLKDSFQELIDIHHPDFLVSDIFYPWTVDLGIPRIVFHGTGAFCTVVMGVISSLKICDTVSDDQEPFVLPGMPHHIEMTKAQLMGGSNKPDEHMIKMLESFRRSYGMIANTFYELESEYIKMLNMKLWHVGPVSLCNQEASDKALRGGGAKNSDCCLNWLDRKEPGSVLYVCFGSLGRFTSTQMRELAEGLQASGHQFMWIFRYFDDNSEWMPVGFENEERNMIVKGWAPQMLILNHPAVGGFMTHCGWNSCIEGASSGVPMIAWPLFAEQFFNEKLLVSVLRIAVPVGAKVCSNDEKKRMIIKAEVVEKAVKEVMGNGEAAEERRKRAKEMAEMAKKAVEEGGSSHNEMTRLIQELMDVKAAN